MKKVFIVLALMVYPSLLLATADGLDYFAVVGISAPDVLNIRSKPTWKSTKVGSIEPLDDCIKNIHCMRVGKQVWCKIGISHDIEGWVNGKYLKESSRQDCDRF